MDLSNAPKMRAKHQAHDPFSLARKLRRAVWVYDTDFQSIAYANKAACDLWNAKDEASLRERDLSSGMSLTVAKRLNQYQQDFLERDVKFTETWTLHPNGQPKTVDVAYSGFRMPTGRMAMMCEVIGDEIKSPETARTSNALFHTDVKIALFGDDGSILYHNPAARSVLPHANSTSDQLFVESSDFPRLLKEVSAHGESRFVTQIYTSTGQQWFDLRTKKCLDPTTGGEAYLVTAYDVSELKASTDRARYLAARDQLTGCFNRSIVQGNWDEVGAGLRKQEYTIIYFDIDMFKRINDTFGHSAGDVTLKVLSGRLNEHVKASDLLARIGGDEFILVLNGSVRGGELKNKLHAIQSDIKRPFEFGAMKLNIDVSIGAYTKCKNDSVSWAEALRHADLAMYCAKRSDTDTYVIYDDSIGAAAKERSRLEVEIKSALENRDFEVFYQPRIDLASKKVTSAEALLRWRHSELGEIPPSKFIPICEEIGVMNEVGAFVFKEACKQLSSWVKQNIDINISINVSPKQFQHDDFISTAERHAAMADFPLSLLELEITETSLVGDSIDVSRRIQRISELGFQLAIDDFGTGYSNLAHISRFPVDCIKVDKSFVKQLPGSEPLLSLIFALAKQIGATIVAEGVETHEQLAWLKENNCDQVQGFLLSQAISASDFIRKIGKLEAHLESFPDQLQLDTDCRNGSKK